MSTYSPKIVAAAKTNVERSKRRTRAAVRKRSKSQLDSPSPPTNKNPTTRNKISSNPVHESSDTCFFRVTERGLTGEFEELDEKRLAATLESMLKSSTIIGEELDMETVGYVVIYENDSTIGYRYDTESPPNSPHLRGAFINHRAPMSNLLKQLINLSF